jgi:hypothetical protein
LWWIVSSGIVGAIIAIPCNLIYTDPCLFLNRYALSLGNG